MDKKKKEEQPQAGYWASLAAGVAAAGVAAWGISRMLSESEEKEEPMKYRSSAAGPSRLLSSSSNSSRIPGMRQLYPIHLAPASGSYKLIIDRACRPHAVSGGYKYDGSVMRGPSGYGGILLDGHGNWVRGFRGFIGESDSTTVEFHGIYKGLLLLDTLGLVDSCIETDSKVAEWIVRKDLSPHNSEVIEDCYDIIQKCRDLKTENNITISLLYHRKPNKYAHKLADMAIDRKKRHEDIMDLPYEIREIMDCET